MQVFAKVSVPGEHLRHPVSQGGPAPSNQTSQFGRTASRTLSPGAPALMSRLTRHLSSRALNVVAHRLDPVRQTPRVEVNFATPQSACSSSGENTASTAVAAAEMVRKPLATLIATVLCNLLIFRRLRRRLAIKSSAQIGAP